jgi:peptidoglycan/LPS O-acetylase OafA/YrhL
MKKIAFLDGVRGLAVISVLIFHLLFMVIPENFFNPFFLNAGRFLMHGVTLFFVLSGFLIGSILINNKQSKSYFKTFYLRRIGRILPIYYALLAIFYFLKYVYNPGFEISFLHSEIPDWTYPFFAQSIYIPKHGLGPSMLSVCWSLCVEEQFYLIAPMLIYFLTKEKLFTISITLILISLLSRSLLPGIDGLGELALITSRIDALLIGLIMAIIYNSKEMLEKVVQAKTELYILLCILLAGLLLLFFNFSLGVFRLTWIALFFGVFIMIPLADETSLLSRIFQNKLLVIFGKYSYGIYLIHMPVNYLCHFILSRQGYKIQSVQEHLVFNSVSILVIFFVAYLSYEYFEKRFIAFGKKYNY